MQHADELMAKILQRLLDGLEVRGILKQLFIKFGSDPYRPEKVLILKMVRCTRTVSLFHPCSVAG